MDSEQLITSDNLSGFTFRRGENVVAVAPSDMLPGYLCYLTAQVAGEIAYAKYDPVLYIRPAMHGRRFEIADAEIYKRLTTSVCGLEDESINCATVSSCIEASGYPVAYATTKFVYDRFVRLRNKVRVVHWQPEADNTDVEEQLQRLVRKAGTISMVIVEDVTDIAKYAPPALEKCPVCGHRSSRSALEYAEGESEHPCWSARQGKIIQTLGQIAKENNICCLSTVSGIESSETFANMTAVGRRQVTAWTSHSLDAYVTRYYGINAVRIAEESKCQPALLDRYQVVVAQLAKDKSITKFKVFLDTRDRARFVCQPAEKNLDNEAIL